MCLYAWCPINSHENFRLLTDSFSVLLIVVFKVKISDSIKGLFNTFSGNVMKTKIIVCTLLQKSECLSVLRVIKHHVGAALYVIFLLNDHKPSFPLRVVAQEMGSWQSVLSLLLQNCLSDIRMSGILSSKYSE